MLTEKQKQAIALIRSGVCYKRDLLNRGVSSVTLSSLVKKRLIVEFQNMHSVSYQVGVNT